MKTSRCHSRPPGESGESGVTMVEVMLASFILSVVAIGTGAYFYQARAGILTQQTRRLALDAAVSRMEELRSSDFADVAPPGKTTNVYYLARAGTNWMHSLSDPRETYAINGRQLPITTLVQFRDIDGGSASYDYLWIRVRTTYRSNLADRVSIESYRAY